MGQLVTWTAAYPASAAVRTRHCSQWTAQFGRAGLDGVQLWLSASVRAGGSLMLQPFACAWFLASHATMASGHRAGDCLCPITARDLRVDWSQIEFGLRARPDGLATRSGVGAEAPEPQGSRQSGRRSDGPHMTHPLSEEAFFGLARRGTAGRVLNHDPRLPWTFLCTSSTCEACMPSRAPLDPSDQVRPAATTVVPGNLHVHRETELAGPSTLSARQNSTMKDLPRCRNYQLVKSFVKSSLMVVLESQVAFFAQSAWVAKLRAMMCWSWT